MPQLAPPTTPIRAMKHQYALLHRMETLLQRKLSSSDRTSLQMMHHMVSCEYLNHEGVHHAETIVKLMEVGL